MKKLLLVNDLAGYGKVALSALIPVLSHMKYETYNLPTAIVSNTLDYGKFDILDTSAYMKNTIQVWKELNFEFDAISTGFIVSQEQTKLLIDLCKDKANKGTKIFVDPIMGDDGKLYNGVSIETVDLMRELISVADYIVPNYTEASYLANVEYQKEGCSLEQMHGVIDQLRNLGAKSVVITSAKIKGKTRNSVVGYDHVEDNYFEIEYDEIPVRFPGTGDIFSSVFMGKIMDGDTLQIATKKAMDVVKEMIERNKDNQDKYKGIPIETCLEVIDHE